MTLSKPLSLSPSLLRSIISFSVLLRCSYCTLLGQKSRIKHDNSPFNLFFPSLSGNIIVLPHENLKTLGLYGPLISLTLLVSFHGGHLAGGRKHEFFLVLLTHLDTTFLVQEEAIDPLNILNRDLFCLEGRKGEGEGEVVIKSVILLSLSLLIPYTSSLPFSSGSQGAQP